MRISDEIRFQTRYGLGKSLKWVLAPILLFVVSISVTAAIFMGMQSQKMPSQAPNVMNPTEMSATTDLYADSFFTALSCMKIQESGGCNVGDKKSKMVQNTTSQILNINDKPYPIPDKKTLLNVVKTTELSKISYATLTTNERGKNVDKITYANTDHTVTIYFSKNPQGELLVKNIDVKKK